MLDFVRTNRLSMEKLLPELAMRTVAIEMLEQYKLHLGLLPTFINRYNIGREVQQYIATRVGELIKEYVRETERAPGGEIAVDKWSEMLVYNVVGALLVDWLNDEIRPGAVKEAKAEEEARIAAMTPAQREQLEKAKKNPMLRMFGGDPFDAVGEPGAGGSFDA